MGSHRKLIRKMIFTSKNPIQNEKSSAKSLPLSIEMLWILPKIVLSTRAENENPSIQTKIAVYQAYDFLTYQAYTILLSVLSVAVILVPG